MNLRAILLFHILTARKALVRHAIEPATREPI